MNNRKVACFFAGVGGIDLGFEQTGAFEVVYANEIDKYPIATYENNFNIRADCRDINTINASEMPESGWTRSRQYVSSHSRTMRISGISYKNKGSQRNGVRKCTTESALTKSKTVFPSDDSLLKMLYLATMDITKKWTGRRRDWSQIRAQLEIYFEERLEKAEF